MATRTAIRMNERISHMLDYPSLIFRMTPFHNPERNTELSPLSMLSHLTGEVNIINITSVIIISWIQPLDFKTFPTSSLCYKCYRWSWEWSICPFTGSLREIFSGAINIGFEGLDLSQIAVHVARSREV